MFCYLHSFLCGCVWNSATKSWQKTPRISRRKSKRNSCTRRTCSAICAMVKSPRRSTSTWCRWVMSHIWTSYVTSYVWSKWAMSRYTCEWVMCIAWLTCEWVTLLIYTNRVTRMDSSYRVASTSRLLKIIGLFCKRALQKRRYSAKETVFVSVSAYVSVFLFSECVSVFSIFWMCVCLFYFLNMWTRYTCQCGWLWIISHVNVTGLFCKRALQKRRCSAKET